MSDILTIELTLEEINHIEKLISFDETESVGWPENVQTNKYQALNKSIQTTLGKVKKKFWEPEPEPMARPFDSSYMPTSREG